MKRVFDNNFAILAFLAFLALSASATAAPMFQGLAFLSYDAYGWAWSDAFGVSGDGSTVVGSSTGETDEPFRWTPSGGMKGLDLAGDGGGAAGGASFDGRVIVGVSQRYWGGQWWSHARSWVDGSPAYYGPDGSTAEAVSGDGKVIVGATPGGAVRWVDRTPEVLGPGIARGVSSDGKVIGGTTGPNGQIVEWHGPGVAYTYGPGTVRDVSSDGVLVGYWVTGTPGTPSRRS
jgi:uncharacterized membrane protein